MMALHQNFINNFQLFLRFWMFMTPAESLTPWVLLIEQLVNLAYIKGNKKILQTIDPFHYKFRL